MVDNYKTQENVDAPFKYEFLPKILESQLTNFIVYDLETYNLDKAKPYNMTFYRLSKIAAKYSRDLTPNEIDTLVFAVKNVLVTL